MADKGEADAELEHLDSHQLIGSLSPVCREAKLDLADEYGLPVRQGGRSLFGQFERDFANWGAVAKTVAPTLFRQYPLQRHAHIFDRTPLSPDYFEYGFHGDKATLGNLLLILETLPGGVIELVCHPGYADAGADGYGKREVELAVLTDGRVREKLLDLGITLTTFAVLRDIAKRQASARVTYGEGP